MIIAYKFNPYLFLNVYIINKRMSLYIDEIYCEAATAQNSGEATPTPITGGKTTLHGDYGNVSSNNITTDGTTDHQEDGYKWMVEIRNISSVPINYGGYRLRVCTNYHDGFEKADYDIDYTFPAGPDLLENESIYVGWNLNLSDVNGNSITPLTCTTNTPSGDNGQLILLADMENQSAANQYYISTRFVLISDSNTKVDVCGDVGMTGNFFDFT